MAPVAWFHRRRGRPSAPRGLEDRLEGKELAAAAEDHLHVVERFVVEEHLAPLASERALDAVFIQKRFVSGA